jgi:hypothetical protein
MLDKQGYSRKCPRARMHTQREIRNTDFPRQQWFRECAAVLLYTYIACLVIYQSFFTYVPRTIRMPLFQVVSPVTATGAMWDRM